MSVFVTVEALRQKSVDPSSAWIHPVSMRRRLTAIVVFSCVTLISALGPSTLASAQIDGGQCEGSTAFCSGGSIPGGPGGSSSGGGGDDGSGGGPATPPTGKYWWYVEPSYGPCGNDGLLYAAYSTWVNDPNGPIVDPAGPDTIQCVEPDSGFGSVGGPTLPPIESLIAQARLNLQPAGIIPDFAGCFVTGAPISFGSDAPTLLTKDLDVPGFHVWMEARPTAFDWKFQGATPETASGQRVTTQYNQKGSSTGISGMHTTKVTLEVAWSGELHIDGSAGGAGQVHQLGTIPVESNIERPLVEVWSAQTNPRTGSGGSSEPIQCTS